MQRKPIIAVTGDFDPSLGRYYLKKEYMEAIWLNGGIPVILEPKLDIPKEWSGDREEWVDLVQVEEELLERIDGVLFTGGGDVDPGFYGGRASVNNGEILPFRDAFEVKLARICRERKIPSLGLCRGIQLMASSMGASLIQDIAFEEKSLVQHSQKAPTFMPTHEVRLKEGSLLYRIYGEKAWVNSFHHQAIKNAKDLPFEVTAWSLEDGIIEGFEVPGQYFVGVQWHPERMMQDPKQRALFISFIEAASLEE